MNYVACDLYVADAPEGPGVNLWWVEVGGLGRAWKQFIPGVSVSGVGALPFGTTTDGQFTHHYKRYGTGNYVLEFLNTDTELEECPSFVYLER